MIFAAETDIWRWQPHPEVWLLIAGAVALAFYAVKVIGPNAVPVGQPVVSRRHTVSYTAAIVALWAASDWPMHDISEEYLYSVHMIQHLIISFIVPPLLLAATPEWLARLIVSPDGKVGAWVRRLAHPVAAGVLFNVVIAVTHMTLVVNTSIENGVFHYLVHLAVFVASMLMWIPVVGPLPELRVSFPSQMIFLFLMSVVPTVPAAFLTFAGGALYEVYDHPVRLWGLSVTTDQQMAGLIMKLVGGMYLWGWIIVRFYQWNRLEVGDQTMVLVDPKPETELAELDHEPPSERLTYEDVESELARTAPDTP